MNQITAIHVQLDKFDKNNKWLNGLSGSVFLQDLRNYEKKLGEQARAAQEQFVLNFN